MPFILRLGLLACLAVTLSAQEFSASLSVVVVDASAALVPGARVVLVDTRWGTVRRAETNQSGRVTFDSLRPSDYTLETAKLGFDNARIDRVTLAVRDRQTVHVELKVAKAEASVTVTDSAQGVTTDPSQGISVDQQYIQNLPLNGRNAESLIMMAPGVTSASGGRGGGGFNANGLRSNTNYFTLDGLSLNSPVAGGGPGGGGPPGMGGGGPNFGTGGSTEMITIDSLQEMRVQTSPFAPEFGRTPGAQVSMTSRGGSNAFHGSLFQYFRNDKLNANDWFANKTGFPRAGMRQNRPGATFGGPLRKNKTFFFASYEALRLSTPSMVITSVPDLLSRRSASAALRPYLNAFPIPNGPALADGAAEFRASVENPSRSDSASLRVDHVLNAKNTIFARYGLSPSSSRARATTELFSPNVITLRNSHSHTLTAGWSRAASDEKVHDFRFNYSLSSSRGTSSMDNYGGAVPLSESVVFPQGVTSQTGDFSLSILGVSGYSVASTSRSEQAQYNAVYSVSQTSMAHSMKMGVDFRRVMPTNYRKPYVQSVTFNGLSGDNGGLLTGAATNAQVSSNLEAVYPVYSNFSAYWQDTYRATERTTLTYGLRWDVNPAPGVREGPKPLAVASDATVGVTQDESLYNTSWYNFAPRIGLAYQMDTTERREMMFRIGAGAFYDLGYGASSGAFNGAPYSSVRTISLATFPLSKSDIAAPAMPPVKPYGQITAAERNLQSPLVLQWSMSVERYFGRGQMLSVGYAGSRGSRLMRTESQPSFSDAYDILRVATNGATSDYHGLQAQFRKRFSSRLQTQFSYTYAHSIDSASNDLGFGGGFASLFGGGERGSSDYDIRHNINWSTSFRLTEPGRGILGALLGDWHTDWVATGRTGLPFDVQGVSGQAGNSSGGIANTPNQRQGLFAQVRPSWNGKPLWIVSPDAPGGKKLNRDAFETSDSYEQGALGRNSLRGFGAWQVDLALRRQISLTEGLRLNISAQAFNAFNHPNFANPSPNEGANLSSPNFGVMTRTLSSQMGGGGVNSIYRSGGARSVELALRLQF